MDTKPISAELLEKYRDCNVDYDDWWRDTYAEFTEDMEKQHIEISDIQFSGFWSQGDGASFKYKITGGDVAPFLRASGLADHFPMMLKLAEDPNGLLSIRSVRYRDHYVYSNMIHCDIEVLRWEDEYRDDRELERAIARINDEAVEAELPDFEKAVNEHMRGLMDELYSKLKQEHEYLTSDEAVEDAIRANEWHLDEDEEDE